MAGIELPDSRIVLQVIPTAPFLTPETIGKAIAMLEKDGVDSVVGVFADVFYRWENGRPAYYRPDGTIPNSCDMKPIIYETTGLYVNRTSAVLTSRRRMNPGNAQPIFVSRLESVDINTPEDFELQRCSGVACRAPPDAVPRTSRRDGLEP